MLTLLLYCLPTIVYVMVRSRRGDDRAEAIRDAGAAPGTLPGYGLGLLVGLAIAALTWLAARPLGLEGANLASVLDPLAIMQALALAAGQEILFRGLIGGVLMRRLGFPAGNALQAVISLLPTLLLALALGAAATAWPLLLAQLVSALLLGTLRHRLGTCFPGIPASALGTLLGTVLAVL